MATYNYRFLYIGDSLHNKKFKLRINEGMLNGNSVIYLICRFMSN